MRTYSKRYTVDYHSANPPTVRFSGTVWYSGYPVCYSAEFLGTRRIGRWEACERGVDSASEEDASALDENTAALLEAERIGLISLAPRPGPCDYE